MRCSLKLRARSARARLALRAAAWLRIACSAAASMRRRRCAATARPHPCQRTPRPPCRHSPAQKAAPRDGSHSAPSARQADQHFCPILPGAQRSAQQPARGRRTPEPGEAACEPDTAQRMSQGFACTRVTGGDSRPGGEHGQLLAARQLCSQPVCLQGKATAKRAEDACLPRADLMAVTLCFSQISGKIFRDIQVLQRNESAKCSHMR